MQDIGIELISETRNPHRLDGITINGETFWFDMYTLREKGGTYINFVDVGYWDKNGTPKWPTTAPEEVDHLVRCILTAIMEGKLCKI
jgi:hypothetical protein